MKKKLASCLILSLTSLICWQWKAGDRLESPSLKGLKAILKLHEMKNELHAEAQISGLRPGAVHGFHIEERKKGAEERCQDTNGVANAKYMCPRHLLSSFCLRGNIYEMKTILQALALIFTLSSISEVSASVPGCQKVLKETSNFTQCLIRLPNYPQPVHMYIPKNLDKTKDVNLNIHFHGHNLAGYNHFDPKYGDYGEYLVQSKLNSVLIVPESTGNCATYDQFFKSSENTNKFINEAKNILSPLPVNSLSLSGHSGAYRVLNTIMGHNKLEEKIKLPVHGIALFDATYGSTAHIENFAVQKLKAGKTFLFFNSYVSSKSSGTKQQSEFLKERINKLSDSPNVEIFEANKECLVKINPLNKNIGELTATYYKFIIDARFKFVAMTADEFPPKTPEIDLHFGILKKHGLAEYFEHLSRLQ